MLVNQTDCLRRCFSLSVYAVCLEAKCPIILGAGSWLPVASFILIPFLLVPKAATQKKTPTLRIRETFNHTLFHQIAITIRKHPTVRIKPTQFQDRIPRWWFSWSSQRLLSIWLEDEKHHYTGVSNSLSFPAQPSRVNTSQFKIHRDESLAFQIF